MIVADTNLIVQLLVKGEWTEPAEKVFEKDPEWVAPLLWRSEFRNALAVYLRRGRLALEKAIQLMEKAEFLIQGREFPVSSENVLNLAATSGCSAYDCEFVALARELGVPLVTSDQKLLAQFPSTARSPDAFIS